MPKHPGTPFVMLIKSVVIVTSPALMTLIISLMFGAISFDTALYSYAVIFITTAAIIRLFLTNISSLTIYVNGLSEDRQGDEPSLKYLNAISELPASIINLHRYWEKKKKYTAGLITEYETLVDSLPDILIMCNNSQKIIRTNKAARDVFGQNLANKALSSIIPNDDLLNSIASVIEERQGRMVEFHLDSLLRDFRAMVNLFFPAASGESIAIIITLNDITELQRVEKMRSEFVANASHEIRTPLASIKGFIETLQGPAKNDAAAHDEFLRIMAEQATRMQNLIDDLLTLSKIQANEWAAPNEKIDITQVIRSTREDFTWAIKDKNMTLRFDIPDNLPHAQGEHGELRQVMHNLIGNAIKYGNAGTEVTVTARVTSVLPEDPNFSKLHRAICIAIIDNGEGIQREHLSRLTERFYRVDSARTRSIGGTGLGLAIVKHIINRHHGVLTIDSVIGEGSTFSVYLQIYEEE